MAALSDLIREVPDFPKEGILFYDITTLLQDPQGLKQSIAQLVDHYKDSGADVVCATESRGFIFGPPIAMALGAGFVPIRKPGKLPYKTKSATYELEYGTDTIEMHIDAVKSGQKVLMIDDLLATGGTMAACCQLVEKAGGNIVGVEFLIELSFLNGRDLLEGYPVRSQIVYESEEP